MKAIKGWNDIVATNGGGTLLSPGGYLAKIIRVKDKTAETKPYLEVVYDILAEDKKTLLFKEESKDEKNDWKHSFRFYLADESGFGLARYKKLVEAVEGSPQNKGFSYTNKAGAEQTLVGKWVGFVVRDRIYTKQDDTDGRSPDLAGCFTTQEILDKSFPESMLEERDTRKKAETVAVPDAIPFGDDAAQPATDETLAVPDLYDSDIPF